MPHDSGRKRWRSDATELLRASAGTAPVRLRVAGECMAPALRAGDVIEVRGRRWYWPGDLVAVSGPEGGVLVHRVLGCLPGRSGWRVLTQGDRNPRPDRPATSASLLGRVTGVLGRGPVTVAAAARLRSLARLLAFAARRVLG
jgi:hypothetical protein